MEQLFGMGSSPLQTRQFRTPGSDAAVFSAMFSPRRGQCLSSMLLRLMLLPCCRRRRGECEEKSYGIICDGPEKKLIGRRHHGERLIIFSFLYVPNYGRPSILITFLALIGCNNKNAAIHTRKIYIIQCIAKEWAGSARSSKLCFTYIKKCVCGAFMCAPRPRRRWRRETKRSALGKNFNLHEVN